MSRIYIRKTSWAQDSVKESVITTQGTREMEVGTLLFGYDKNIIADKVFLFLVIKLQV